MKTQNDIYRVSDEQKQQFQQEGYMILENALTAEMLEYLRTEAGLSVERCDRRMDELGTDTMGITHRGKRYFVANLHQDRPDMLKDFLLHEQMAELCRATIGDDAWLFCEQMVIKSADTGMSFSWHQDSGYVHPQHKPYITFWIALDDVNEENGTVYLLPYSESGIRSWVQHIRDPETNDRVGYFGEKKGIPAIVTAGSIVVFSSIVFHCSGANRTQKPRRAYVAQYSPEIIRKANDWNEPWNLAIPFLRDGKRVSSV